MRKSFPLAIKLVAESACPRCRPVYPTPASALDDCACALSRSYSLGLLRFRLPPPPPPLSPPPPPPTQSPRTHIKNSSASVNYPSTGSSFPPFAKSSTPSVQPFISSISIRPSAQSSLCLPSCQSACPSVSSLIRAPSCKSVYVCLSFRLSVS